MCIVLVTTAHPSYALIVIDNRDEFILRPTSRPHWWLSPSTAGRPGQTILSSRDLQRAEQGTWLGVTKAGNFAVLTNYRETNTHDADHPVEGTRSRGGMVTAWLTADKDENTGAFVHRLLENEGVKGVGGFSLLAGKLRKRRGSTENEVEPMCIISNRCGSADDVPWIAERRGEVYGLSNTAFTDPEVWPKVHIGKEKLLATVEEAVKSNLSEEELTKRLFAVLDTNTLPPANGRGFEEYISELKNSIFIPSVGAADPVVQLAKPESIASAVPEVVASDAMQTLEGAETPAPELPHVMSGVYGTQRQTVLLVDWEGKVSFVERALYDEDGKPILRGNGDVRFEFEVEGWEGEEKGREYALPASHI